MGIVARRAGARDCGQAQGIIEPANPRDGNRFRAEELGAPGDRGPFRVLGVGPGDEERHRVRIERGPARIRPEDVVDRDVEGLRGEVGGPSLGATGIERAGAMELLLGRREVQLE